MSQEIVKFAGAELLTVKENDRVLVALKPICTALSLDYSSQVKMVRRDETLASVVVVMTTTGSDGKDYKMFCLPLNRLNGWLFKLSPSRVKDRKTKELILKYQRECYQALAERFLGMASQPMQKRLPDDLLAVAENRLRKTARLLAAYIRYELRSRIIDFRHIPAQMVAELAIEAGGIPCTYAGFEKAVWDIGEPSDDFVKLVAKLQDEGRLRWMDGMEWK